MAPFPFLPMAAILGSLVSTLIVQMSVFSYAGFMVEYLGVVDDQDKAGETEGRFLCITVLAAGFRVRSSALLVECRCSGLEVRVAVRWGRPYRS